MIRESLSVIGACSAATVFLRRSPEKMGASRFRPGFRLSLFDIVILCAGVMGSAFAGLQLWWAGMIVGLVVLHFFLFCNVFRISRAPELIWAAAIVALAGATILTDYPGWIATPILAVALSSFLIWRETKREDYHGVCWKKWNPGLPDWWQARQKNNNGEPLR